MPGRLFETATADQRARCAAETAAEVFAWLCRVAGAARARAVLPSVYLEIARATPSGVEAPPLDADDLLLIAFELSAGRAAVDGLATTDRALLELVDVRGRSLPDAAMILQLSAASVGAMVAAARLSFLDVHPGAVPDDVLARCEVWLDDDLRDGCRTAAERGAPAGPDRPHPMASGRWTPRRVVLSIVIACAMGGGAVTLVVAKREAGHPTERESAVVPSKRWQRTVDGFVVATVVRDRQLIALSIADGAMMIDAFDVGSGTPRWSKSVASAAIGGQPGDGTFAELAVVDDSIVVDYGFPGDDHGTLIVLDMDGSDQWTAPTASAISTIDPNGFLIAPRRDGGSTVQTIDFESQRVADPIDVDAVASGIGFLLIDRDGALTKVGSGGGIGDAFVYHHDLPIQTLVPLKEGTVIVVLALEHPRIIDGQTVPLDGETVGGPTLVALAPDGSLRWTFDTDINEVGHVQELSDGRLLVGSNSNATQIIDITSVPAAATEVRAYQRISTGPGPAGRDVVFGFQGVSSGGGGTTVSVLDESAGSFRKLFDIVGFTDPEPMALGERIVVASSNVDGGGIDRLTALDSASGAEKWEVDLGPDTVSSVKPAGRGFVVLAGDPRSIIAYYA